MNFETAEHVSTDVLVIGGGAAGLRAALAAREEGAKVILVNKGRVAVSGATAIGLASSAGFAIPDGAGDPLDNPDVHFGDIMKAAQGCADPRLVRILVEEAANSGADLGRWNVPFITDPETGKPLVAQGDFASRPRNRKIFHHGKPIAEALKQQILEKGVTLMDQTMVLSLLGDESGVDGALVMQRDGTLVAIRAGATVLTTGGAGQLFRYSLMPPDITGDGYALGYRAGARMSNMEFMQAGFGTIKPALNIIMAWFWAVQPRFVDRNQEDVVQRFLPAGTSYDDACRDKAYHYPFSASDKSKWIEVAAKHAIAEGRATDLDGFWLDLRAIDERRLAHKGYLHLWNVSKEWLKRKNMNIETDPLQVGLMGHAINGGMVIDTSGRSSVPGLLAAGEAATGPYGADRLGGNMLLNCLVFGRRAGIRAVAEARSRTAKSSDARIADALAELRLRSGRGELPVRQAHAAIKETMSKNALIVRNETGMAEAVGVLEGVGDDLRNGRYAAATTRDIRLLYEAENLVDVGLMMLAAARLRKETRGSHFRDDAPEKDAGWEKSIILHRSGDRMDLTAHELGEAAAA